MGFEHGKRKNHNQDSMWTSYSDLFLGLSVIFLLLYVTASLRQSTDGIRQFIENKELAKENHDLQQQLKVYESIKQNYLETQAKAEDVATYDNLMAKLDLLQDEAKTEKNKLRKEAFENEQKEKALNQYQQIVRNIINTNVLAKSRIRSRDTLITKKEGVIKEQSEEIGGLESNLQQKLKEIDEGKSQILQLETTLAKKLVDLDKAYKSKRLTQKKYRQQQQQLKKETQQQIAGLQSQKHQAEVEAQLLDEKLQHTSNLLATKTGELERVGIEKTKLEKELAATNAEFKSEVDQLRSIYEEQKNRNRRAFDEQIKKERLTGLERSQREAAFRANAERRALALGQQIGALEEKYIETQGELSQVKGHLSRTQGDLGRTQTELALAQENLNSRRKLAESIKSKFASGGVRADVDARTGDVLLSFGGEYFDTGDAKLKPGMKTVLEKAMPSYAQSLFEDPKIAEKIEHVEIVGFASPTYQGKFIDPSQLSTKDRQAVNYNLDLSYGRARSIFDHVYSRMNFQHKQRLLPLVKVTGRSFLGDAKRNPANDTKDDSDDTCRKLDCARKQTVIIKFKLKD